MNHNTIANIKYKVGFYCLVCLLTGCSVFNFQKNDSAVMAERIDIDFTFSFVRAYSQQPVEDQRKDLAYLQQQWTKERSAEARIKYALALAHSTTTLRDDQKALQLLEDGVRPEQVSVRLSLYLQSIQVLLFERLRLQRDEERKQTQLQQKIDNLQQKQETSQQKIDGLAQKQEALQQRHDSLQQKYEQANLKAQALQKKLDDLREIERVNMKTKRAK